MRDDPSMYLPPATAAAEAARGFYSSLRVCSARQQPLINYSPRKYCQSVRTLAVIIESVGAAACQSECIFP